MCILHPMRPAYHSDRLPNLLGALALAIDDQVAYAVCSKAAAGRSSSAALVHLSHSPPGGVEPLRRALGLSHSATVRLVDRLASSGLLDRVPASRDRRSVVLSLTSKGRELVTAMERERLDRLRRLLGTTLSAEQQELLTGLVEAMLRKLANDEAALWRICRMCAFEACPDCPVAARAAA